MFYHVLSSVPDPDLEIGGRGGGGGHPDPELRGGGEAVSKMFFFGPSGHSLV